MSYTDHYGLKKLRQGEHLSADSYKFTDADRDIIDLALFLGAEGHRHIGGGDAADAPTAGLNLQLVSTSGSLPGGTRVFYRYTIVDVNGAETGASPEVFLDTPAQVASPSKPTLTFASTGGTLPAGNYYYVLSAYTGTTNYETPAINPEYLLVTGTAITNAITITLPALPSGATGFNIYRQAPNGPGYFFITNVDMSGATPPTSFVDTGAIEPNCDRTRPTVNTTLQTNSVVLTLPTALSAGQNWRVYRTMVANDYQNSLLTTITNGSTQYTDTGAATTVGQPPAIGLSIGNPPKVVLTDGAEVQGRLPLSAVSAFPHILTFALEGDVFVLEGTHVWVCEYPQATVVGVRAALGRGYTASEEVVVDVNVGTVGSTIVSPMFAQEAHQPRIAVGQQVGQRVAPTAILELVEGDWLSIDVDAAGGATARDLVVQVYLHVYGWATATSHPWA